MARNRFLPHRVAPDAAVTMTHCQLVLNGQAVSSTVEVVDWDYSSTLEAHCTVTVHPEHFLEGTRLDSLDQVRLICILDCPQAMFRQTLNLGTDALNSQNRWHPHFMLSPGAVAGDLVFKSVVILGATRRDCGNFSATQAGSLLWEGATQRVQLEGQGGRFPTESVSFKAMGYAAAEHVTAPWRLNFSFGSEDDSFLGAARLFINTDHPASEILGNASDPRFGMLTSMLEADIVGWCVAELAQREDLVIDDDAAPTTVIGAVEAMTDSWLNMTLDDALERYRQSPADFDAILRHRTSYLHGLDAQ